MSRGYPSLHCKGFSLQWLLLLQNTGSPRAVGFSSCSMHAHYLRYVLLVAPQHVASSQTTDWSPVPCISSWILNQRTTKTVLYSHFSCIPFYWESWHEFEARFTMSLDKITLNLQLKLTLKIRIIFQVRTSRTSLVVQWLRIKNPPADAGDMELVPGLRGS